MSWNFTKDERLLSTFKRLGLISEIKDGHHGMLFEIVPVRKR